VCVKTIALQFGQVVVAGVDPFQFALLAFCFALPVLFFGVAIFISFSY
jgi:hypothetical protein